MSTKPSESHSRAKKPPIWWSNTLFFVGMHVTAVLGVMYFSPWRKLQAPTAWLCFVSWQLATFGITMGYHRLWSHKTFTCAFPLRVVLAGMGCLGFQGSIRFWVLRHRLHHRFTDSESDPYNAQEGLYHSHMGWIFRKPVYPRMALIDRKDLDLDPVVRFQHKHYLPLTLGLGLVLPTLIGWSYGDAMGGFIWGGIVARILIWHCTFLINSLAHALGDQAYSEDVTARGNFILAIFTGGEANHNYHHAFPHDYRNGPRVLDWDPTKWCIYILHHFTPFVPRINRTSDSDILKARAHVLSLRAERVDLSGSLASEPSSLALWSSYASATSSEEGDDDSSTTSAFSSSLDDDVNELLESSPLRAGRKNRCRHPLPTWSRETLLANLSTRASESIVGQKPLVLILSGYIVDATNYASEHPGGVSILRKFAVKCDQKGLEDATEAFFGGVNVHGWTAREKMKGMRLARLNG